MSVKEFGVGFRDMKKVLVAVFLGFLLSGCYAPTKTAQKSLIDHGAIKIGMNGQLLLETLGESYEYYPLGKKGGHVWFEPASEYIYHYGYFDNYWYGLECPENLGSKFSNCTLVKIWQDKKKVYEYYIDILPEGKEKNQYVVWAANLETNPEYITWKNKKKRIKI